jgi:hypothetical protein
MGTGERNDDRLDPRGLEYRGTKFAMAAVSGKPTFQLDPGSIQDRSQRPADGSEVHSTLADVVEKAGTSQSP